jgi:4-coumarate--CoA ligase
VPPIVLALVKSGESNKYDLSSIRAMITGAAPMGMELEQAVKDRLPHTVLGQVRCHIAMSIHAFIICLE